MTTIIDQKNNLPKSSSVKIKAKIKAPQNIKNIFSAGFLFPHGTSEENTEVYMAKNLFSSISS